MAKQTLGHDELKNMVKETIKGAGKWFQGWNNAFCLPFNPTTGKFYRGVNVFFGMGAMKEKGSNLFAGRQQWFEFARKIGYFNGQSKPLFQRDENGKMPFPTIFVIAKGYSRKAKESELASMTPEQVNRLDKDGDNYLIHYSLYRALEVFNVNDLVPELAEMVKATMKHNQDERCSHFDEFVASLGITIKVGEPAYYPSSDIITMPPFEGFNSQAEYGGTMAHEIGHWTGAKERMNRKGIVEFTYFGADPYAEEEAVAHWFSVLMKNYFGLIIPEGMQNDAAYLQGWTKRFAEQPELLESSFRQAEQAFNWVLKLAESKGFKFKMEEETEEAEAAVA